MRDRGNVLSLADCEAIARRRRDGWHVAAISDRLGLPHDTVAVFVALLEGASDEEARAAVTGRADRLAPEQAREVRRLRRLGWSVMSIARRVDAAPADVAAALGVVWGRG